MLKTLAAKHQSTVSKMAARHKAKIETPYGLRTCFEARVERDGKQDLVARFGGIPLIRDKDAVIADRVPKPVPYPRKELIHRLLTRRCELCGDPARCWCTRSASSPASANPDRANPRGRRSWPPNGARPSWSAPPATTSSTPTLSPTRRRSLESPAPGHAGGAARARPTNGDPTHPPPHPKPATRTWPRTRWTGCPISGRDTPVGLRCLRHATVPARLPGRNPKTAEIRRPPPPRNAQSRPPNRRPDRALRDPPTYPQARRRDAASGHLDTILRWALATHLAAVGCPLRVCRARPAGQPLAGTSRPLVLRLARENPGWATAGSTANWLPE